MKCLKVIENQISTKHEHVTDFHAYPEAPFGGGIPTICGQSRICLDTIDVIKCRLLFLTRQTHNCIQNYDGYVCFTVIIDCA